MAAQKHLEDVMRLHESHFGTTDNPIYRAALKKAADVARHACLVQPDGGNPTEDERLVCEEAWRRILALPVPDLRAALASMVKPLEWEDFDGLGAKASAFYQANYLIQKWSGEGRYEVAMSYPGYQTGYDGPRWHPTLEAAKAAAQADYTRRILAAVGVKE